MINLSHNWFSLALTVIFSCAIATAQNSTSSTNSAMKIPKPPATRQQPVTDDYFGHKVTDPYRWLEDGSSAETQQWVTQQLGFTRGILDQLPGRKALHARIEQLLEIGNLGETEVSGDYYFHLRRDGKQNQPVLYVRKGVDGRDEVLLDPNQLAKDGTIALDWWAPSHDGRYVAYGTSPSGSEMSTLHVMETASRKLLPDTIDRTRAASIAWKPDDSGFFYTRYPKAGEVAAGQEMYNRHVFYHPLGGDPAKDAIDFRQGPRSAGLARRGALRRWPLAHHHGGAGLDQDRSIPQGRAGDTAPQRITTGKEFLYFAWPYKGDLYIMTNEDGPRYRVFKTPATHAGARALARDHSAVRRGTDLPERDRRATHRPLRTQRALAAQALRHRRQAAGRDRTAEAGNGEQHRRRVRQSQRVLLFSSFTAPTTIYRFDIPTTTTRCGIRYRADRYRSATRPGKSGTRRRTGHAFRCSWSCARD